MSEIKLDPRYCAFIHSVRGNGERKYQCRRPPHEDGLCKHHTKREKEKGSTLKTLYAMPRRPLEDGFMPKEKKVLDYNDEGVYGRNRMRTGWQTRREMLFKSRLMALQWKRLQLLHEVQKLQREDEIARYRDAIAVLAREIDSELEVAISEVAE